MLQIRNPSEKLKMHTVLQMLQDDEITEINKQHASAFDRPCVKKLLYFITVWLHSLLVE